MTLSLLGPQPRGLVRPLLTRHRLKRMAGPHAFKRGEELAAAGAVRLLSSGDLEVTASVRGNGTFRVRLWAEGDRLQFDCSCLFARDMACTCKHFVAVGLVAAGDAPAIRDTPPPPVPFAGASRVEELDELRALLAEQDAHTLSGWLLAAARNDRQLARTLLDRMHDKPFDEAALRELIDDATDVPYFVWEHEAPDVGRVMERMAASLRHAMTPATAGALVPLVEYAFRRVQTAMEEIDDSRGYLSNVLLHLGHLHCDACNLARPDPVALAERLFALAVDSGMMPWPFDHGAYAEALGEAGVQHYREVAEQAWNNAEPTRNDSRWVIGNILEHLAGDDVDRRVEIIARDLTSITAYLAIVETLDRAGRHDEAAMWAERAVDEFPDTVDDELFDMVARRYIEQGKAVKAAALRMRQLQHFPSLERYRLLATAARAAGRWPAMRNEALRVIDNERKRMHSENCSLRVEIALWENDIDTAWQYANTGRCDLKLLVRLAPALVPYSGDDAFACYRRIVQDILDDREDSARLAAKEAIAHVRTILQLLENRGRDKERAVYLDYLRAQHGKKRHFMALLDALAE